MAGDHVPLILLVDVVGNGAIADPVHCGGTAVKVGVIFGFIVIVKVVVFAHNPAVGVKV